MDNKPIVGIDLDGCVAEFNQTFYKTSRKLFGRPDKSYHIIHYDHDNPANCWTKDECKKIWAHLRHTYNFWETLDAMPNTKQLMRLQNKITPIFITSRVATDGNDVVSQAQSWLERNFGIRDALVIGTKNKGQEARDLGVEYFIDDKPENCEEVLKYVPGCKVYIQNATYNVQFRHKGISRVQSLNEFLGEVLKEGEVVEAPSRTNQKSPRADGRKKPRLRSKR